MKRSTALWSAPALAIAAATITVTCQSALEAVPLRSTYDEVIAPILARRCGACHGETKAKGDLRVDALEALLRGGESGPAIVAGQAAASELVRRMRLPLDDIDHMPPDDKPQPDADEIAALEVWIDAGASTDTRIEALHVRPRTQPSSEPIPAADERALAALRRDLVHVQPISAASNGLWIDFAAIAPRVDDAWALRLLAPLREQVVEVSLARSNVGAGTLELLATMPRLRRVDLRGTAVDDAALAPLARHARLEELVIARTKVSDASVELLLALPELRRVYVWQCGLSGAAVARLRATQRITVDAGDAPDALVAEAEPAPKFTSDLPIPGAPQAGDPNAPVNTSCPLTGSPVNPKYTRTFEGRVIGFCCPNCPLEFDKDPATHAAKVP